MTSFRFKIKQEVKSDMGESFVVVAGKIPILSRARQLLRGIKELQAWNANVSKLTINYQSRAGPAAEGNIKIDLMDNRIDGDLSSQIIASANINAKHDAIIDWNSSVYLPVSELTDSDNSPLGLTIELLNSNMKPNYSIGSVTMSVHIKISQYIERINVRTPQLREDNRRLIMDKRTTQIMLKGLDERNPEVIEDARRLVASGNNISQSFRYNTDRVPLNRIDSGRYH